MSRAELNEGWGLLEYYKADTLYQLLLGHLCESLSTSFVAKAIPEQWDYF